jgi:cytochrome c
MLPPQKNSQKEVGEMNLNKIVPVLLAAACWTPSWAVDAAAAQALVKKSDCLKCHAVDKKKDGPSFKETSAKYKGKPDGEEKLIKHLTTSPKVKVDGKEEEHAMIKSKNQDEIKNVAQWILSQ